MINEITEIEKLKAELAATKKELKDVKTMFNSVVEHTLAGYWENNLEKGEMFYSPTFIKMLGYTTEEWLENELDWENTIHPEDKEKAYQLFKQHIESRGKIPYHIELRYIKKNQDILWVFCKGECIKWSETGAGLRVVGCHVDITDVKLAQNSDTYIKELERINDELKQFSYIASHDLQEPIRSIQAFTDLLKNEHFHEMDTDAQNYISYIKQSSVRMQKLINMLLEFSQLGNERELIKIDLNHLLKNVQIDLSNSIRENAALIEASDLPVVEGYKTELRQLFMNLLSNAIKFRNQERKCLIRISCEESLDSWTFCVADNGIGIKEKHFEKIFLMFQRLHHKTKIKGSGIGLAHCKKIIDIHKGKIWVDSKVGEGSRFYFTLPKVQM